MCELEEIEKIKKKMYLLFDSPITTLTELSGKSRPTVSKFFNLRPIRPSISELLYDICLELIEQKEKKRQQSIEKERSLRSSSKKAP